MLMGWSRGDRAFAAAAIETGIEDGIVPQASLKNIFELLKAVFSKKK